MRKLIILPCRKNWLAAGFQDVRYYKLLNINDFYNVKNKFDIRHEEYEFLLKKDGNYKEGGLNLEFGVFKGNSIEACATIRSDLIFWGFDSFVGLPEIWEVNDKYACTKETHSLYGQMPGVRKNGKIPGIIA